MLGGFNWIDGVVVVLLIAASLGNLQVGVIAQMFAAGAFFATLFAGGWLLPHLLPIDDRTIKAALHASLLLVLAGYASIKGFEAGRRLHWSLRKQGPQLIERWAAVPLGIAATLTSVWLAAALLGWLPFAGLSNSVNDAVIVQALQRALPPVPAALAPFHDQVDPYDADRLPYKALTRYTSFPYDNQDVVTATAQASESVVRITGFGCGGLNNGSGFAVGDDLVATNAHIIAGVKRPIVKWNGHSYEAVPVYFDASLDVAIIRIRVAAHPFEAPPLRIARAVVPLKTTVGVLGYPNGTFKAVPGLVRNDISATGRTIYDYRTPLRTTYEVQTTVAEGSSGGPIVLSDGRVAGIVTARYTNVSDRAIALASVYIADAVERSQSAQRRVGTGACWAN